MAKEYRTNDGQIFPRFVDAVKHVASMPNASITMADGSIVSRVASEWLKDDETDVTKRINAILQGKLG